jgi:hypothetical protein
MTTQYADTIMNGYTVGSFKNAGILLEDVYSWGTDNGLTAADLQKFQTKSLAVMLYLAAKKFAVI